MSMEALISLIVLLPLLGLGSTYALNHSGWRVSAAFIAGSFFCSVYLLFQLDSPYMVRWEWLPNLQVGISADKPAAILLALVGLLSLLVHLFSMEYMKDDTAKQRYFAKLAFFTFSMMGLLVSDSLILLFVFWELVGFSSYLLIGFWFKKDSAPGSARMAFMVNKVADVALLAGILMLLREGDSTFVSELGETLFFLPSLLIAIGAFGKSAQLPFSGWIVKAMAGPTPISALIHAATMVAAGVYLLFRIGPFLDSQVLAIVTITGIATAMYGALSAITQNDIKKVLAYSTISQLGYMVMGIGVSAGEASIFHLWTHAFFKAGLFLGAGVVIHTLHQRENSDPQDMRQMGGIRSKLPWTFVSFLVCSLALAGIPFFSGFMSKEGILLAAWTWAEQIGTWAYLVPDLALVTILITAFYVGRLVILVFLGESRYGTSVDAIKFDENAYFKIPLTVLAIGSIWFVYNINPLAHTSILDSFFGLVSIDSDSFIAQSGVGISIFLSIAGAVLAFSLFKPKSAFSLGYRDNVLPNSFGGRVIYNGFYLINAYRLIGTTIHSTAQGVTWVEKRIDGLLHFLAMSVVVLAKVLAIVDRLIIDGIVNFLAWIARVLGNVTSLVHARESQWQIIWLLIAFVLILSWILFF